MALKPNYEDYEDDYDYLVACECYGLELEYEEEARMCEEEGREGKLNSEKESNITSIGLIVNEFENYWDKTYSGEDFNSFESCGLSCDLVTINDTQLLFVVKQEQLKEFEAILKELIVDYEIDNELSLSPTNDYDNLLFSYERAIIVEDITE